MYMNVKINHVIYKILRKNEIDHLIWEKYIPMLFKMYGRNKSWREKIGTYVI